MAERTVDLMEIVLADLMVHLKVGMMVELKAEPKDLLLAVMKGNKMAWKMVMMKAGL